MDSLSRALVQSDIWTQVTNSILFWQLSYQWAFFNLLKLTFFFIYKIEDRK